jgi:hypothetical protein
VRLFVRADGVVYEIHNLIVGKQVGTLMVQNTFYQCIRGELLEVLGVEQEQLGFLVES